MLHKNANCDAVTSTLLKNKTTTLYYKILVFNGSTIFPAMSATCMFESITKYRKGYVAVKCTGYLFFTYPVDIHKYMLYKNYFD